jgi:hypothetical protein
VSRCVPTHDHGLVSAAKTRDLRSALPRVNYLLADIGSHGWPRSGAMLTERLRKLSSNLIDAHALDVPTLERVDKRAVFEQGNRRRRWRHLGHALARAFGRLPVNSRKNRGQVIRDDRTL